MTDKNVRPPAAPRPGVRSNRAPALIRRRLWLRRLAFLTLALLGVSAGLDRAGCFRYRGDDWGAFDRHRFLVSRVIDGDTLTVRPAAGAGETKVRLIGVDAPELTHGGKPDHWAGRARDYARARAEGKQVTLRLDATETRDRYGRLLAYVYLSDAETLNEALVRDGQAYADRRFKHTLAAQFEQAEGRARAKGTGLWAAVREDESLMPEWRQEWLRNRSRRRNASDG